MEVSDAMMLVQDTDFNALLQTLPLGQHLCMDLGTGKHEGLEDAPDEATGSQPSSEGEKDTWLTQHLRMWPPPRCQPSVRASGSASIPCAASCPGAPRP